MFSRDTVLSAIKFPKTEAEQQTGHCRMLEARARALGFQSYHQFQHSIRTLPNDDFGHVSLKVMRFACQARLPSQDCPYFEFRSLPKSGIGFYSMWIGWDHQGEEIRVPRPLVGTTTATGLRKVMGDPVYVVETAEELHAWVHIWHSTALIPEDLAKKSFKTFFDKEKFAAPNPPMDLVERNSNKYINNFAT